MSILNRSLNNHLVSAAFRSESYFSLSFTRKIELYLFYKQKKRNYL